MFWFFIGIFLASFVIIGFTIRRLNDLIVTLEKDRLVNVEERALLHSLLTQMKSWIESNECENKTAVSIIKEETAAQTKILTDRLEEAKSVVVDKVEKSIDPLLSKSPLKDCL